VLSQTFETIVNRQAAALARRQQIHDAFLRIALTGGGLARLSGELAEILPGADVVICDPAGHPLAATTRSGPDGSGRVDAAWLVAGVHRDPETGTSRAAAVIRAGEMRHGWVLAVGGAQGLPGMAGVAVEQAALVAALEITRDLAVLAVEQQFASNALHDLVTGTAANLDQVLERAVRFGWDLQRPLAVLVARDCGDDAVRSSEGRSPEGRPQEAAALRAVELWTRAVHDRDREAAVAGFATELVAVVGLADPAALARKIHADMTASTGRTYAVGVSQVGAGPLDIPRLYEEARVALQVGQRLNGSGAVTNFAGLGLYRLISNVSQAELRAFVHDTLGPVLDLPEPGRSDLLKSLAVLSSTRFNVAESARILHYHYNTMRYRVTKLERMLGEFADNAAASLRIGVALEILRMYEISGDTLQTLL
jgi:PucR family transcriptional regulator, purine catabolism regulatory protein